MHRLIARAGSTLIPAVVSSALFVPAAVSSTIFLTIDVAVAACSRTADPALADAGTLTEARRQQVIDAMQPLIEAHYISLDAGKNAAAAIRDHAARGDYARVTREDDFAQRLTDDLRAVTHDVHFRVRYESGAPQGPSKEEDAKFAAIEAKFGIIAADVLPGNIGSLRIDSFRQSPRVSGVAQAYADAMTRLADTSALIVDLRENYGGDPATVAFFESYLFDRTPVHLDDIWSRDDDSTWQLWTRADLPGKRFGGEKPVFVLVSRRTISGGEAAAYELQALKRATVVGETTRGGANPAPRFDLVEGFAVYIPSGRVINPITHTNWEGVGVLPDVRVDAADAPREALARAGSM